MTLLFSLAILPVLAILIYVYKKDINKEPIGKLIITLIVGCLIVIPAGLQEGILDKFNPGTPIVQSFYKAFVEAGFSEELWKFIALMLIIWNSRQFSEYFDGIIYAVYISMGFAAIENIMYVFGTTAPLSTAIIRAIVSVPGHFLFAVAMGYYLSLAKFDSLHPWRHLILALLVPILLHGTFDFILMVSDELGGQFELIGSIMTIAFIVFDIMLWRGGMKRIRRLQARSKEQSFDRMKPFENFQWKV